MSALPLSAYQDAPLKASDEPDFDVGALQAQAADAAEQQANAPSDGQTLVLEDIASQGIDLAQVLDDNILLKIAGECFEAYERDKSERADWESDYEKTAAMLGGRREAKTFPWPDASNVIYPLIATATIQFGSRAYQAIVKGQDVVKTVIIGEDIDGEKEKRGDRIREHMNWQLLEDMPEWEDETDKLVHMLPWMGCVFRQAIWDPTYTRPKTSLISAKRLVVTQDAKDLETVPIFTKEFDLFPHQIMERMRSGDYLEEDIGLDSKKEDEKQGLQLMLECHCRYDLDEDGYPEPYIAVIHHETQKLLSLKAGFWASGVERQPAPQAFDTASGQMVDQGRGKVIRVRRHVEFIKYDFLPDFEGKFLGIGFGFLLREHNAIINTLLNQLIDAATDQNLGGGFIGKGVNLKGGYLEFERGEWKYVDVAGQDLKNNMVPRITSQPSPVLFQLLGTMIEAGKELANVRDVLTGEAGSANQPATTTLAIIEQGLQVFSSIYKRIYRAMGGELKLIYKLNGAYLPEQAYFQVMDTKKAVARHDYAANDNDVAPVADPSVTTSAQELARAAFLDGYKGNPLVDQRELVKRQLAAARIPDIDKLIPEKPADPMQAMLAMRHMLAEIKQIESAAMNNDASAALKAIQAKVAAMGAMLDAASTVAEITMSAATAAQGSPDGQAAQPAPTPFGGPAGGMGGMAGAAPNQNPAGLPFAGGAGPGGELQAGGLPGPGNAPSGAGMLPPDGNAVPIPGLPGTGGAGPPVDPRLAGLR